MLVTVTKHEFALQALPTAARVLEERLRAELHTISVAEDHDAERLRLFAAALGVDVSENRVVVLMRGPAAEIARRAS